MDEITKTAISVIAGIAAGVLTKILLDANSNTSLHEKENKRRILEEKMNAAAEKEDYAEAIIYRDQLKELQ
jgi:excinuclease UvrABC helicase subunit UvrB